MGDSAPPPPQKRPFFAQKRPKNANFGPKPVFFGLGWPFQAPHPILQVLDSKKSCVAAYGSRKMGESGPPPPKNGQFLPKKKA